MSHKPFEEGIQISSKFYYKNVAVNFYNIGQGASKLKHRKLSRWKIFSFG